MPARVVPPSWSPKFGWGIARDTPLDTTPDKGTGSVEWTEAPPTSHIARFRYFDAREHPVIRKYGQHAGKSQLHVVFKDDNGSEANEYWYFFPDHDAGRSIFDQMVASAHPYGEVLYTFVVTNRDVPYQRQSA